MGLLTQKKSGKGHCAKCGETTAHEKTGPNYDLHFILGFLTCGVWVPIWIAAALIDRARAYRCVKCNEPAATKIVPDEPPPVGSSRTDDRT